MKARCVIALVLAGASSCDPPCVPRGEHDFFMVSASDFAEFNGTMTFHEDKSASLTVAGQPARRCENTFDRDQRGEASASCQVAWTCRPVDCANCPNWYLTSYYRPSEDGTIPQSHMDGIDGGSRRPGAFGHQATWSAARRTP